MNILYIGDIMAEPGIITVEKLLPGIKKEYRIQQVIAQAENVTGGKGISQADYIRLHQAGVDFFTGGNHILHNEEIFSRLNDPVQPIIRPANYLPGTPGLGWKYLLTPQGKILVISLLGRIVGRQSHEVVDNPLRTVDAILKSQENVGKLATIINLHGDYSSEKVVIGHYLDGRVTAVIGDHWHVPTADARILPKGTAHITDVGMVGALNSSLGVKSSVIFERWRDGKVNKNDLEITGPRQFNAVLIDSNEHTGLANSISQIQHTIG